MREIICNPFFPCKIYKPHCLHGNTSILSIGANLKNPLHTFCALWQKICKNNRISILSTSPIYKNPPFGYTKQNDFYNAIVIITTNLCLIELYRFVFYMERIFGRDRKRAFANAPRTLDIDILFFNDVYIRSTKLNIPHLHWWERESVIVPLYYQVYYKGF